MPNLAEVQERVEHVLRVDERSRNDDKWLIYLVLRSYTNIFIPYDDFRKLPSFESISRVRRKFQNNAGLYLPTDPKVQKKRNLFSEEIRLWSTEPV